MPEGSVSSKNPISDAPKIRNRTKKIILGTKPVAISLAVCGPINNERKTPKKVNIIIIERP